MRSTSIVRRFETPSNDAETASALDEFDRQQLAYVGIAFEALHRSEAR